MRPRGSSMKYMDWTTFSIYIGLISVGLLMVYTVDYEEATIAGNFFRTSAGKQAIWMVISVLAFFLITLIEWKFWQTFSYLIYGLSIFLLVAVLFLGTNIKGATSWFTFGSFSFQPAEIAKFGTSLALANFLSTYNADMRDIRTQFISFAIFLVPTGLILLQPDAGSALVFMSFTIMLYREGLSPIYFIVGGFLAGMLLLGFVFDIEYIALGLIWGFTLILSLNLKSRKWWWALGALAFFATGILFIQQDLFQLVILLSIAVFLLASLVVWRHKKGRLAFMLNTAVLVGIGISFLANYVFYKILEPHQQDRINVWLQPSKCDPRGSLYNVLQSKMAISSGGLQGKGFLNGTMTKLNYVPEQSTDFIFCTIGEEQGFLGSFGIIALYFLLLYRITIVAERQRSGFSRRYAYAIAGILFVHYIINIGMTMGLMPIIGIPLPFISKGGSSLLGFTVMLAVLLKLDANRGVG